MAPETLRSETYPVSDVWAAGVMAHQLLTGRFPFDDKTNPFAPSLSKVWCVRAAARGCSRGGALAVAPLGTCVSGHARRAELFTSTAIPPPRTHPPALGRGSILGDEVDFKRSHWEGISEEAKDFVRTLLVKDPLKRPSALDALQHPWLQGPGAEERGRGKRLGIGVVQRIQVRRGGRSGRQERDGRDTGRQGRRRPSHPRPPPTPPPSPAPRLPHLVCSATPRALCSSATCWR